MAGGGMPGGDALASGVASVSAGVPSAVEALGQARKLAVLAADGLARAIHELDALGYLTSDHMPVAGDLWQLKVRLLAVTDDLTKRLQAEQEGER